MAFMVKSRLARSSSIFDVKETESGCLLSEYSESILNVVTSNCLPLTNTDTVPCFIPVSITLKSENTSFVSSGFAFVVMSMSEGVKPIK